MPTGSRIAITFTVATTVAFVATLVAQALVRNVIASVTVGLIAFGASLYVIMLRRQR
jgi:uncharacterized membrane protein YgdD (TMEM256/DUF423 family)